MTDTRLIEWSIDGQTFEGRLALPAGTARGTVLVCHAWSGRAEHEEAFAERLADKGYVAMAGDVYGKGVRGSNNQENEQLMKPLVEDRAKLLARLHASIDALNAQPEVDAERVAAAGFCFGGLSVLDLARANAPVKGVAAFHAILTPPNDAGTEKIRPQVIAFQGFDDPMAGPDDLKSFGEEMTARSAPWQLYTFGGVGHAFTNEGANDPGLGLKFDAFARDRSYHVFDHFLDGLFG